MRNFTLSCTAAVCLLLLGLAAVAVLSTGDQFSITAYLALATWSTGLPGVHLVSELGVIALVLCFGWSAWRCRALGPEPLAVAIAAGSGVVTAYAASETVKLLVAEERPCRVVLELSHCPEVGDWSFPSNHTVIAAGLAVACLMALPGTARAVVPLAVLVAFGRVAAGVHYPHDVVAGACLAVTVVIGTTLLLRPPAYRLLVWSSAWPAARTLLHPGGAREVTKHGRS